MQYVVVIEKAESNYGAYVPDCVAVAETRQEVVRLIHETIALHLESLREEGATIPEPTTTSDLVEV